MPSRTSVGRVVALLALSLACSLARPEPMSASAGVAEPAFAAAGSATPTVGAAASAAGRAKGAASGGPLKFSRLTVKDPGVNNIEALSLLIPSSWRADGGITWLPDFSVMANLLMTISDPATGATLEFLPVQNFTHLQQMIVPMAPGTNYMGNIIHAPVYDVVEFARGFYAPQAMPQLQTARVVAQTELTKVAQEISRAYGGQSTVRAERVRYEYTRQGKPWQEDLYVTLVYTNWYGGTIWSVNSAYSLRAPKGELDRVTPLMTTTLSTLRLNPQWFGALMYSRKLFENRMYQSIRNAKALSDTITRNSEEIRRLYSETYREQQASQDRISQSFSEYVRGVETYSDPYEGRPVELPSGYNDAWVSRRGEYILSNDPNFNPNVGDNTEWRRMEQTQQTQ